MRPAEPTSFPAHVLQRADELVADAPVIGVFHQAAAQQKLHGQVVDLPLVFCIPLYGDDTAHDVTDDLRGGQEYLLVRGAGAGGAEVGAEFVLYGRVQLVACDLRHDL